MHPRGGTRRGGALQVPPADDHGYDPGGILGGRGGTEARAVERERPHSGRLHVRHRNRPVHGHPGQRIERAGPAPGVGGRPLHSAQRRGEGRGHGVHAAAGHRGAHALRRHHAGQNIQLHNPGNAQGRAPLFVHDRRHAGAGATDLGRLFRLDGLPARQHLPVAGFHPRVARRLHDLRFALRVQRRDAQRKIPLQMVAERRIRLYEHDQDHQGTGALHRRAACGRGSHVRPAPLLVELLGARPPNPSRHSPAGRPDAGRLRPGQLRPPGTFALHAFAPARPFRAVPRRTSGRDGARAYEIREHEHQRQ